MGSLAYVGNAAIFDFGGMNFAGGVAAVYLWRAVYFSQSVSLRTRILLAMDWTKRALFGRGKLVIKPSKHMHDVLTCHRSHELLKQTYR
jgi:NADH dehydrogenase